MTDTQNLRRTAILSGLITAVGILSPVIFAIIMTRITNQHGMTNFGEEYGVFVIAGLGVIVGGLWGGGMARLTGITRRWRMRIAGALTFNTAIFLTVLLLVAIVTDSPIEDLPQHQIYLIVFPFSAFLVSMLSALGLHLASTKPVRGLRNALLVGLVSGVVFLILALIMDVLGYRIGSGTAGHPIKLPPMPFVTITSTFVSALISGGLLGVLLSKAQVTTDPSQTPSDAVAEQREQYA